MKRLIILTLIFLVIGVSNISDACTIVMLSKNGVILAGNNEDWKDPFTSIWFIPATDDEFGRVCFGFGNTMTKPQGGMNDQGLFLDGNALGPTGWKADENKSNYIGHIINDILAKCATCDDAAKLFGSYNFPALARARFPIADRTGASIVVEWGQDKLQIVKKTGDYQISTNFVISNFEDPEKYPCNRYKTADRILKKTNNYSVDLVREILSATHQEGNYPTTYSNICDLKNGDVYIYNFHNFENVVKINLDEELKKGKRIQEISSLFPYKSHAHKIFLSQSTKATLYSAFNDKGIERGIKRYHQIKKKSKSSITEEDINSLGYQLMREEKTAEAIALFRLNVEENPNSWNVYDSLAEAYMNNGEKELAIKNYEISLKLNPDNENGKQMLKKLREK